MHTNAARNVYMIGNALVCIWIGNSVLSSRVLMQFLKIITRQMNKFENTVLIFDDVHRMLFVHFRS